MRGVWVAVALAGLPATALAQTSSNAQSTVAGTLVDETPLTPDTTPATPQPQSDNPPATREEAPAANHEPSTQEPTSTQAPASPAQSLDAPVSTAHTSSGVASGVSISPSGDTASSASARGAHNPTEPRTSSPAASASNQSGVASGVSISPSGSITPSSPAHSANNAASAPNSGPAQSGVAAPRVSASGGGSQHAAAPQRATIQAANALERAFLNAARQETERAAFRRLFLTSQVALATVSADANAAPRLVRLGPGGEACLIFTSDARASQIMGATAPRKMMTGREALERIRGAHLAIININLDPYLTLDAAGIESFLSAGETPTPPARSAGPSQ